MHNRNTDEIAKEEKNGKNEKTEFEKILFNPPLKIKFWWLGIPVERDCFQPRAFIERGKNLKAYRKEDEFGETNYKRKQLKKQQKRKWKV